MTVSNISGKFVNPAGKPVNNNTKKADAKIEKDIPKQDDVKDLNADSEVISARNEAIESSKGNPIPGPEEALKLLEEAMLAILSNQTTAKNLHSDLQPEKVLKVLES